MDAKTEARAFAWVFGIFFLFFIGVAAWAAIIGDWLALALYGSAAVMCAVLWRVTRPERKP